MRYRSIAFIALAAFASVAHCADQPYPTKPVRYVTGGSAGSSADTLARVITDGLSQAFGKQFVVENRPGSNIAPGVVLQSPPDGHALLQTSITQAVNATLYRKLNYDLVRDLVPVTRIATEPALLVVHPSLPVKSVRELVAFAKARPGALNYGSGGMGTYTFFATEIFKGQAGIDLVHVPYRGGGAGLAAILSGEVSVYFLPVSIGMPNIAQKRLRALAVSTAERLSPVPDLPTIAEAGVPGYESGNWFGIHVPAKTPASVVMALHNATRTALNNPPVKKRLQDLGFVAVGSSPEEFAAYVKLEIDRLGKIIRAFDLHADD